MSLGGNIGNLLGLNFAKYRGNAKLWTGTRMGEHTSPYTDIQELSQVSYNSKNICNHGCLQTESNIFHMNIISAHFIRAYIPLSEIGKQNSRVLIALG